MGDKVLTLQAHPEFNQDFGIRLLHARKTNIESRTYLQAMNEFKNLEHDGKLIVPNIINFLENKLKCY